MAKEEDRRRRGWSESEGHLKRDKGRKRGDKGKIFLWHRDTLRG